MTASAAILDGWRAALAPVVRDATHFHRSVVVDRVGSTQELAASCAPGTVVVAHEQIAGRGRLGRRWRDSPGATLPVTCSLPARRNAVMSLAAGVALHDAVSALPPSRESGAVVRDGVVGLKWPNDLVIVRSESDGAVARKLGGVLVEVRDGRALVGIGVNMRDLAWPEDLASKGASLEGVGISPDLTALLVGLVRGLDQLWREADEAIIERWCASAVMRDAHVVLASGAARHEGRLVEIDPAERLVVERADGTRVALGAGSVSILSWTPAPVGTD